MTRYCFDTSALLDAWTRSYPPDVFPQLWRAIEEGIAAGHFFAAEEVRVEITKKDDSLLNWAKKQRGLFVDLDVPQQTAVADPFVIALARTRDAVVVTGENDDGSPDKPKIPTVCRHFGIRAIKPLDFIRENRGSSRSAARRPALGAAHPMWRYRWVGTDGAVVGSRR